MSRLQITVIDWKPVPNGVRRGFATVALPGGLIIHDVVICAAGGRTWALPPGRPQAGPDGRVLTDEAGKRLYTPVIGFETDEARRAWSEAILAALRQAHPEAFDD
jgi:hypothetical protein